MTPPANPDRSLPAGSATIRSTEDFVALVPNALGFLPERSAVLLAFGAPVGPFQARCDLPDAPDDLHHLVEALVRPVRRHRAEAVALVIYDDDTVIADSAACLFRDAFADEDVAVLEIVRVHASTWFAMLPGHPVEHYVGVPFDLQAHPLTARAVMDGRVTRGSREELRASLEHDPSRALTTEVIESLATAADSAAPGTNGVQSLVAGHLAARTRATEPELARLAQVLSRPSEREQAWIWLSRELARPAVEFWSDAVRRLPDSHVVPAAAVLAFAAWLAGDGALAWCAVDRARAHGHSDVLAELVARFLVTATPPGDWALVREEVMERVEPAA